MSITLEKTYLPQYIQFQSKGSKPEYVRLETESDNSTIKGDVTSSPIVEKSISSDGVSVYINGTSNHPNHYPQSVYPQLLESAISVNPSAKTPLLIKKKIVPTKTNYFGVLLAFVSGVFFTLCSGTVKYLTDVDPMELLIFRSSFQV